MINNCHHGEAFLWHGTGIDEVDDAIMSLVRLSELDLQATLNIADEIMALVSTARHRAGLDNLPDETLIS